jgi:hypothetical protein
MTAHRQCACAALVFTFAFACGGDKGDTKLCKELRAEFEAQDALQKKTRVTLQAAVSAALATPPVGSADNCEADGLNWQKFTHLTPKALERGHLGDPFYLGEFQPSSSCGQMNQETVKGMLANLQTKTKETAAGNRLFFADIARVDAELLGDKSYKPGNVKGQLLVWSVADQKFICTGEGYAESGKNLYTTAGGVKNSQDLNDHLTRNAVKKGIPSLKKIDPDAKAAPAAEPAP